MVNIRRKNTPDCGYDIHWDLSTNEIPYKQISTLTPYQKYRLLGYYILDRTDEENARPVFISDTFKVKIPSKMIPTVIEMEHDGQFIQEVRSGCVTFSVLPYTRNGGKAYNFEFEVE